MADEISHYVHIQKAEVRVFILSLKRPQVKRGGCFVHEAHFFYRNWEYCDSNIRLWFCHKSMEKHPVLYSGTISWLPPERISTLLHRAASSPFNAEYPMKAEQFF